MDWLIRVLGAARSVKDAVENSASLDMNESSSNFPESAAAASPGFEVEPLGPALRESSDPSPYQVRKKKPQAHKEPSTTKEQPPEESTTGHDAQASLENIKASADRLAVNSLENPEADEEPKRHKHRFINRKLDRDAVDVVRRLRRHEHSAYLVGGCVRDLYLGLSPKDFDVSTSAKPEEIKKIFRNSRIIGRRFRLAHIYFRGGKIIETATFRGKSSASDQDDKDLLITRDNVWGTEREDALRRDFTINGLMYDTTNGEIIDHVGGLSDLDKQEIRTIGDPDIRLQEDPVRILRAIRFSAKLNFKLETQLKKAMIRYGSEIKRCATARVLEETLKLFRTGNGAKSVEILISTQTLESVLPQLIPFLGKKTSNEQTPRYQEIMGYFNALDELVRARGQVSDAVILTTVLMAPIQTKLDELEPRLHAQNLNTIIGELTEQMLLTRRIKERARQLLMAQKHLKKPQAGKRPRRRISPQAMVKRSYFADALDFFEIWTKTHSEDFGQVMQWRERAGEIEGEDMESHVDPKEKHRVPRKRRRRKRRSGAQSTEPNNKPKS